MKKFLSYVLPCLLVLCSLLGFFPVEVKAADLRGNIVVGVGDHNLLVETVGLSIFMPGDSEQFTGFYTYPNSSGSYGSITPRSTASSESPVWYMNVTLPAGFEYVMTVEYRQSNIFSIPSGTSGFEWILDSSLIAEFEVVESDISFSNGTNFVRSVIRIVTALDVPALALRSTEVWSAQRPIDAYGWYRFSTALTGWSVSCSEAVTADDVVRAIEDQYNTDDGGNKINGAVDDKAQALQDGMGSLNEAPGNPADMFFQDPGPAQLVFPAMSIEVAGETHSLWEEYVFSFGVLEGPFAVLVTAVRLATTIVVYIAMLNYMHRIWKEIFGGD